MSAAHHSAMTTLQEAAAAYAEHGVAIFPVQPRGKLPVITRCPLSFDEHGRKLTKRALAIHASACPNDGHGFHDASADVDRVNAWWTTYPHANIAVALGVNDLFVVDVDGPQGRRRLDELEAMHTPLPATYQVVTGRAEGHGRHHVYRQPSDRRIPNGTLGDPKLEIRGDGGYVIAPPSIHESGRAYLAEGSWAQIANPPLWLIEEATKPEPAPPATPSASGPDTLAERRLQGLAGHLAMMGEDSGRNNALNHAGYVAGQLVAAGRLDRVHAEQTLTTAANRSGLDLDRDCGPSGIAATIASGIDAGLSDPDYAPPSQRIPEVTTIDEPVDDPGEGVAPATMSPMLAQALQRIQTGDAFILDTDHQMVPVWGDDTGNIAWARGEPLILTGPTGVGKTTVAHQLLERLLGLNDEPLFDLPVPQRAKRILYLACDRPNQIRRAFARRFHEEHREELHDHLVVHNGYLPVMVDQDPGLLVALVKALDCDIVVIDSLKDVASELEKGPNAQAINAALQMVCQAGADVIVLHHQRKSQGDNKRPKAIDDLYGNTLIPAGAGSVLLLWGGPGDMAVELHHLKKPVDEVGPLKLLHRHQEGVTVIDDAERVDLVELARRTVLTVPVAAQALYGTPMSGKGATVRNEREKARYQLDKAVTRGVLIKQDGGSGTVARYVMRVDLAPVTVLDETDK